MADVLVDFWNDCENGYVLDYEIVYDYWEVAVDLVLTRIPILDLCLCYDHDLEHLHQLGHHRRHDLDHDHGYCFDHLYVYDHLTRAFVSVVLWVANS